MTISANYMPISYIANGVTTSFSISWRFVDNDIVVKDESGVEYSSELYTVYNAEGKGGVGGYVVFKEPPTEGRKVIIYRNTPFEQNIDFVEGENFPAQDFEYSLDKLFMALQEASYNTRVELDEILSSIYTKAQIDEIVSRFASKEELVSALNDYYTKNEVDKRIDGLGNDVANNYYTKSEIDNKIGDIDNVLDVINGEKV